MAPEKLDEQLHNEAVIARLTKERHQLKEALWQLAAPLGYASDGSIPSLIYNLTVYVRTLENPETDLDFEPIYEFVRKICRD